MNIWYKVRIVVLVLLAITFCFWIVGSIQSLAQNQAEAGLSVFEFAAFLWPYIAASSAVFILLGLIFPQAITTLGLAFICLSYLQANVFVWSYGVFDGTPIVWKEFRLQAWLDLGLWVGFSLIFILFRARVFRRASQFTLGLVLLQLLNLFLVIWQNPGLRWFAGEKTLDHSEAFFQLSSSRNVIFILLDAFQAEMFNRLLRQEPTYQKSFKDFIFFSDTASSFPTTFASIPSILSGVDFDNSTSMTEFMSKVLPATSLPALLAQAGFKSSVLSLPQICTHLPGVACDNVTLVMDRDTQILRSANLSQLFALLLFRSSPQQIKRKIYVEGGLELPWIKLASKIPSYLVHHTNSIAFVRKFSEQAQVTTTQPVFQFYHLNLPHPPYWFDAQCNIRNRRKLDKHTKSFDQSKCALSLASELISTIKSKGVYDRSMLIILADHGLSGEKGWYPKREGFPSPGYANPLLLIKPPNYQAVELSRRAVPARLADLGQTVLSELGIASVLPGLDIFKLHDSNQRTRVYRSYHWRHRFWMKDRLPEFSEYAINGKVLDLGSWSLVKAP